MNDFIWSSRNEGFANAQELGKSLLIRKHPRFYLMHCNPKKQIGLPIDRQPFGNQSRRARRLIQVSEHEKGNPLGRLIESLYSVFQIAKSTPLETLPDGEFTARLAKHCPQQRLA